MTASRLRNLLVVFFLALAVPSVVLVVEAYGQLKWEAFHQHQQRARELSLRIDAGFDEVLSREESRPFTDYEFLNVAGSDGSAFLQRSPLSEFPLKSEMPGLLGYFQVDASGQLATPTLPKTNAVNYGISSIELQQRQQQQDQIRNILNKNRLVPQPEQSSVAGLTGDVSDDSFASAASMEESEMEIAESLFANGDAQGQSGFDEISSQKQLSTKSQGFSTETLKDFKLEDNYQVATAPKIEQESQRKRGELKKSRKEKASLPQSVVGKLSRTEKLDTGEMRNELDIEVMVENQQVVRIQTFESEIDPMEFSLLDSGHFVLFRRVWFDNQRYVQGMLIEKDVFVESMIAAAFRQSSLSSMSELIITYRGKLLKSFTAEYDRLYPPSSTQVVNELLYRNRLIAPFADVELNFSLMRLPIAAGGHIIIWSASILALVLMGGFVMLYRLGLRQLALARQQQDFISAVSHELKTPLTSIRMYGEMLREGWADKNKLKTYYDFIFYESERLTRLINNVLQLARLGRSEQQANLVLLSMREVIDELEPRLQTQTESTGFELTISGEVDLDKYSIQIDLDWFTQIFINLVDNAIKFSNQAENKQIDILYQLMQNQDLQFSVRDYGPGIDASQLKKIFTLFYRSENELTRETVGTGIGLALVQQLSHAMHIGIDVVNCNPGAEFRLVMPTK